MHLLKQLHHKSMEGMVMPTRSIRYVKNVGMVMCLFPTLICLWYAIAAFFPSHFEHRLPGLIWTEGFFVHEPGQPPRVCPKEDLCADGVAQIVLLAAARLSAFAMYPVMVITFMSKMPATTYFLSHTYIATFFPPEFLHLTHTLAGQIFGGFAFVHSVVHLVRWGLRHQLLYEIPCQCTVTGVIGMLCMFAIILPMLMPALKRTISFESRLNAHWLFILVLVMMLLHSSRTMIITAIILAFYCLDHLYLLISRTYRVDLVEFRRLPDGGVQIRWRNPRGFDPSGAGEYIQIRIPWLAEHGDEWHPFSIYQVYMTV